MGLVPRTFEGCGAQKRRQGRHAASLGCAADPGSFPIQMRVALRAGLLVTYDRTKPSGLGLPIPWRWNLHSACRTGPPAQICCSIASTSGRTGAAVAPTRSG